jgi:hemerythrin
MNLHLLELTSSVGLDVESMDLQHRYLLRLIGRIVNALRDNNNETYLNSLFTELNEFARFHFRSEETIMKFLGYPGYLDHYQKHIELLERLALSEAELELEFSRNKVYELFDFLADWFTEHTSSVDKAFASYVKSHPHYLANPALF